MTYSLNIPGWTPTTLNKLLGNHWAKAGRMKAKDREILSNAVLVHGIPEAVGKRRVDLLIVHPKGKRFPDPDALWKSCLDGLAHTKALFTDTKNYVELGSVEFARGDTLRTIITLTNL